MSRTLLAATVSASISCASLVVAQSPAFSDRTAQAGITHSHQPAYAAGFAAGGAVGDFNRDGFQDIYLASGGVQRDRLYINNGDGTFSNRATQWGIATRHRGTGGVVGDFDGDGWLDLFVTSLGPSGNDQPGNHKLYHNDHGTGFTDVAVAMGVNSTGAVADGWGGAFGDYDLDGDLDLAVCGWRSGSTNRLFRNDGTTFTDVTVSSGIAPSLTSISGFSAKFVDLNGDRYPEIVWIGDFGTSKYFRNNGNGTFTDRTANSNTADDGTEMGITITDIDEDGRLDFYVTTIGSNNLYRNLGAHTFSNVGMAAGVDNSGWGWGTVAIDMNHDMLVDFVATSQSSRQYAFRNTSNPPSNLSFSEVGLTIGLTSTVSGRGLSNIDYDNDGDQDLVIFPSNGPLTLYRNDLASTGQTHWLRVFLDNGCASGIAPDGVGSIVEATVGSRTFVRMIDAADNYLSNSELSAHFGLGGATQVDTLRVLWPDGQISTRTNVPANQTMTIRAPSTVACSISVGAGCDGATGVPRIEPQSGSVPGLGTTFAVDATGLDAGGAAAALLFAFDRFSPSVDLAPIGMAGCRIVPGTVASQALGLANVGGAATWSLPIGNSPGLAGRAFHLQAVAIDPGAPNSMGIALSNALRCVLN
ncbi:MAG: CRTAC1 family protein [Planctomycetes bacterium]|nr:CRTAC1 family protein [Planctomycetota bacterium]